MPPVLWHFFTETFRHPGAWLQARTAYTRSTAVASMTCHVLGLGDRHLQNILLDQATAEVVHIDLGIAFDQVGKGWKAGYGGGCYLDKL